MFLAYRMFLIVENNNDLIPLGKSINLNIMMLAYINNILFNKLNQTGTDRLTLD